MALPYLKKPIEELFLRGPPFNCKEVDDLNEQPRLSLTSLPNCLDQLTQTGNKAIMSNSQQRAAGNIAYTRGFNYKNRWFSLCETPVPIKVGGCNKSVFRGSPGNHCRHPGAALKQQSTDLNWLEEH